jgi:beta-lactamase superfamily II metal-dependent hydrolase
MFRIHMLDADHGDCLWIDYGTEATPKRLLIDAGTPATWERALKPRIEATVREHGRCMFELFVVTHIDEDHIGGALRLIDEMQPLGVTIREVWFNGFLHLSNQTPDTLGAMQGEKLTELIQRRGLPWNRRFERRAVMVPERGALPARQVGGMKLTLLSPTFERLQALRPEWEKVVREAGLVPGAASRAAETVLDDGFLGGDLGDLAATRFKEDEATPNGSSIAFVAEYDGKSVLFGADAYPSVLLAALARRRRTQWPLDALKLPHHGSRANVSSELIEAFPATHYLVSTSGARFRHPNDEALARVVCSAKQRPKVLHFNYRSPFNREWEQKPRQRDWNYTASYPRQDAAGLSLVLA